MAVTTTQVVPFQQLITITVTATATSVVSTTVDKAVYQQVDSGLNCPGFGGPTVVPITVVNTPTIYDCLRACFLTTGCTLIVTFDAGNHWTCEL